MAESLPHSSTETFDGLLQRAEELTQRFEQHPNSAVREDALELLQTIDAIHREAIFRLVDLIVESGNHELIHRAADDAQVSAVLQLYDVMPLPELVRWQELLDSVQADLQKEHAGIELLQITDGMPRLRLTGSFPGEEAVLRQRVQDRIAKEFGALQSIRWEARLRPPAPVHLVTIAPLPTAKARQWIRLLEAAELHPNEIHKLTVREMDILLCQAESGYHAFPNACPGSALPLHMGRIAEGALLCPWHACAFNLVTGKRTAGTGLDLKPLTLRVNSGFVELGVWE